MRFAVTFKQTEQKLPLKFGICDEHFEAEFGDIQTVTTRPGVDYYDGEYEVTPTGETQVLPTVGKYMSADVTVKPIPKEYGLVSYDNRKIIKIT